MRHKYIFAIAAFITIAAAGWVWAANAGDPSQAPKPHELVTRFSGRAP